jgi:hypothetical protein
LVFVQGKRRFPRSGELNDVVSDALDRNLSKEDFHRKHGLDTSDEPDVDNPEEYYLETLQVLEKLAIFQEEWHDYLDGKTDKGQEPYYPDWWLNSLEKIAAELDREIGDGHHE